MVKEYVSMLPIYELVLIMLRFKLDKDSISFKEIKVIKKYEVFNQLFPIKDPSHNLYIENFNNYIATVPSLKKYV